jgi:hypothetical protein
MVQFGEHVVDGRLRLVDGVRAEVGHQPRAARREQPERVRSHVFLALVADELVVEALQRHGPILVDRGYRVGGRRDVGEGQQHQHALRGFGQQAEFGAQHGDAGRLGADERLGQVEPVLGQQRREVVTGDPPGQLREVPDPIGVAVTQLADAPVDVGAAATGGEDAVVLVVGGRADPHADAVVRENLEAMHVGGGGPAPLRGGSAGVVADHPAYRAVVVGGRLGAEDQPAMGTGLLVELVEDDTGLHDREAAVSVDRLHRGEVLGEVHHHGDVAALAGEAGAATAGEDRRAELTADRDGRDEVIDRPRDDDADRDLPVVGGVGGVQGPGAAIEADPATHPCPQGGREPVRVHIGGHARPHPGGGKVDAGHASPFNCSILSLNRVVAIAALCGWPRRNAVANFFACS